MHKILIVDDEKSVRYSFKKLFNSSSYRLLEAGNAAEGIQLFQREKPSLAIIDIEMPGKSGLELLKDIKGISPATPVIIITAYGSGDRVINAMKFGAYEYVEKPFDIPKLISLIEEAVKFSSGDSANDSKISVTENPPKEKTGLSDNRIIGESPAIKEVFKLIGRVAASDASILIVGESGTGKELVAKAIHKYSDRANKPFIAINCAAIPDTLLESELFGFEKGAFTGADKFKPGKFDEADEGTLFLDEIGDLGFSMQAKLLRVLQEGSFERLGSTKTKQVNVRVIAATNKNLENDIQNKSFREDLYYRLKVVTITLPPLRMRKEDLPILIKHFLLKHSRETKIENVTVHPEAISLLMNYEWPGNIRELENVIKRAIILSKGNIITPALIITDLQTSKKSKPQYANRLDSYLTQAIITREGDVFRLTIEEVEKDLIVWALSASSGNQAYAARILGISRVMLHERMERFGLAKDKKLNIE